MRAEATRVEVCVTGRWVEDCGRYLVKYVGFAADAIMFDNQWVELRNVTTSTTYAYPPGTPCVEEFQFLRVPVRKIERLTYDLCE